MDYIDESNPAYDMSEAPQTAPEIEDCDICDNDGTEIVEDYGNRCTIYKPCDCGREQTPAGKRMNGCHHAPDNEFNNNRMFLSLTQAN